MARAHLADAQLAELRLDGAVRVAQDRNGMPGLHKLSERIAGARYVPGPTAEARLRPEHKQVVGGALQIMRFDAQRASERGKIAGVPEIRATALVERPDRNIVGELNPGRVDPDAVRREGCRHRPRMRDHEDATHVEDDRVDLLAKLTRHAGNATASGLSGWSRDARSPGLPAAWC